MPRAEIPEGIVADAQDALRREGVRASLLPLNAALKSIAPQLYQHWLEQLKEELLSDESVERQAKRLYKHSCLQASVHPVHWSRVISPVKDHHRRGSRRHLEELLSSIPIEGEERS